MSTCSIKWCGKSSRTSNLQKDGITFHRFPKSPTKKEKWISLTRREENWYPKPHSVVCSRHFSEDNFSYTKNRRRLMKSAIPSLYLPILFQILTCQFPTHVDFQRIGEVTFHNEVYKVLKPQQHFVKESKDALRRENTFPKEGLLIDTNGRIHYWKGLIDSSDKSEQKHFNISENIILRNIVENLRSRSIHNIKIDDAKGLNPEKTNNNNIRETKPVGAENLDLETEKNDIENISEINTTLKSIDENDPNEKTLNEAEDLNGEKENASKNQLKDDENPNEHNDMQDETKNLDYETTTDVPEEDTTTMTKRRKRKEKKIVIPPNTVYTPPPLREGKGKTVVKTTFFCPFLGIVTMSSLIDV